MRRGLRVGNGINLGWIDLVPRRGSGSISTPVTYILRDLFTTTEGPPLASPRTCEPTGTLTLLQTTQMSIASAKLVTATAAAWNNEGFYTDAINRVAGRTVKFTFAPTSIGTHGAMFGIGANDTSLNFSTFANACWVVFGGGSNSFLTYPIALPLMAAATQTYVIYQIMRSTTTGGSLLIVDNKLLWVFSGTTTSPVRFKMSQYDTPGTFDDVAISDYPAPYTDDWGAATGHTASPADNATLVSSANAFNEFTLVAQSGVTQNFYFRRTDDNNNFRLECDQTNGTIKLYRNNTGSETELDAGKTQTWTVGNSYRLIVICDGSSIKTYVQTNPTTVAAKHSVTDAFNQTATGLKVSTAGADLASWPLAITPPAL